MMGNGRRAQEMLTNAVTVVVPLVFCYWLFRLGLKAWFQQDDFAHLGLAASVHSFADAVRVAFQPIAQGTVRPLSERMFFIAGYALFGLDAVPYRIAVFVTQAVNIALVVAITARLTGSRLAGAMAAILWTANTALMTPLSWTCAYNEVLWAALLLAAFYSMLRGWTVAQWCFYLLGFGALEMNVVYAPLVTAYAALCDRRRLKSTAALWVPAIAYAAANLILVPKKVTGVYAMHFDFSMARTFATYWTWAFGAVPSATAAGIPAWLQWAVVALATITLVAFAVRKRLAAFFIAWFVITIAPVLPLRNHLSDYYLAVPTIGLAMAAAYGLTRPVVTYARAAAVALAAVYLYCGVVSVRFYQNDFVKRSWAMRKVVLGIQAVNELHPGKTILLTNVDDRLFWSGFYDQPFRLAGENPVYVAPDAAKNLTPYPDILNIADYTIPEQAAVEGLRRGDILVYAAGGDRLMNITEMYRQIADSRFSGRAPSKVDVGNPLMNYLLDGSWYPAEDGYRWIPKAAGLRMGGPETAAQKLHVSGYCAPVQLKSGPLVLTTEVDGQRSDPVPVPTCDQPFDLAFAVPERAVGEKQMNVRIEVNRATRYGEDARDLGVAIRTVEVR
jgi:hypothetical protein